MFYIFHSKHLLSYDMLNFTITEDICKKNVPKTMQKRGKNERVVTFVLFIVFGKDVAKFNKKH